MAAQTKETVDTNLTDDNEELLSMETTNEEETMEETANKYNAEALSSLTKDEIKEVITARNEEIGTQPGDPGYITLKGNKDALVDRLLQSEALNTEKLGRAKVQNERTTVKPSQLVVHSSNYRHDTDYYDVRLQARFRASDYEFLHDLVVTPTGEKNDDGPEFRIVSGNRSFWNFVDVCRTDGVDLDSREVPVNIREYTDEEELSAQLAETIELGMANEAQRRQSPVDKMRWFKDLSAKGLTQAGIAEIVYGEHATKNKQSIISKTLKLSLLPTEVLDLVHYDFMADEYAANGVEWLEAEGIPFSFDSDGNPVVEGMTQSSAEEIMSLYPRTNAEGAEEGIQEVNDFVVNDPTILEAGCAMTTSAFKKFLRAKATEADVGTFKRKKALSEGSEASEEELAPDVNVASDEDFEGEGISLGGGDEDGRASTKTKAPKAAYLDQDITAYTAATDLERDQYQVADDWSETFQKCLHDGEPGSVEAFKFLYHHGILEDVID